MKVRIFVKEIFMLNYGKTITALRKQRGMTQAELGNALNVTYQAVSKWENNLAQPGIDVLADICKIFNISMDEFVRMAGGDAVVDETATTEALTGEQTAAIVREELNRMEREKQQEIALQIARKQAAYEAAEKEIEREEKIWHRVGFGISCGVGLLLLVIMIISKDYLSGLIVLYASIAFGSHLGHDCLVDAFFKGAWDKFISMPGVIFSLDIDGILFLFLYKFIIAPIASLIIGLACGIGGTILAILLGMVSFPFKAYTLMKETFGKA